MSMPGALWSYFRTRWLLWLVLIVFTAFKIQHLRYPFYIDEGWVYAPAVKAMAAHGPSLMPGAIPAEYSRGHPLLFHFLCASWMRCFGGSNTAIHSFALLISLIFLFSLFEVCMRLFGREAASLALLMMATRVVFFVQSSFVYPEVMLALFALLAVYYYARNNAPATALLLFLTFFTKEGGLVIGAVMGADAVIRLFRRGEPVMKRILRVVSIILPTVCMAGFFIIQKHRLGWYVLPEHTGLIKAEWNDFYTMFRSGMYWAFRGDKAMCVLGMSAVGLSVIPAIKQKDARYLFLSLPAIVVAAQAQMFPVNENGGRLWMAAYLLFFSLPVYFLLRLQGGLQPQARRFIAIGGAFVIVYVIYSSLTQIAYRYLIVSITFTLIFISVSAITFIKASSKNLFGYAALAVLLIGAYGFYTNERAEDTELGAYRVMNVQMHEVAFLEKERAYDKEIAFRCTWDMLRLTDTMEGFLDSGKVFTHMVRFPVAQHTDYAIFGNLCDDKGDYPEMQRNPAFHLAYQFRDGDTWGEIYKHN